MDPDTRSPAPSLSTAPRDDADRAYAHWRSERLRQFDEDYAAWRATGANSFPPDFDTWRQARRENFRSPIRCVKQSSSGSCSMLLGRRNDDGFSSILILHRSLHANRWQQYSARISGGSKRRHCNTIQR